ncbi:Rib/alpha-like domain-containing protein [Corynebacterium pseudogenitalium]|uniref:Ig domain-containing protein n=1 Tax=Corynebacterium pseudogenitalium TaxID=38303 RepID=A0ABD4TPX2_9CORY|nr:Rib/alpha-like domain-containing protein [Corynebacterium pseudogenitalium]MCQ4614365.1 putative Ig domain-containing protein [Corynebacterium pseudogenitalium]
MRGQYKVRRGTSIAAAALSFALVAPLAQPVAFAQDVPVVAAGAEAPAEAKGKNQLVPNAIYTKGGWRDYYGYHGYAYINKNGRPDSRDDRDEPLKGNVIYLQYVNGKGEVSPTFYTLTDSEGRFSFDLSEKVTNEYDAPAFYLAGDSDFKVRVWGENPDKDKYSVVMAGDMQSGRYTMRTDRVMESWNFTAGPSGSRITAGRFVLEEKPAQVDWLAKPESEWTRALDGQTGEPTVDGQFPDYGKFGAIDSLAAPNQSQVWWESGEDAGSLPGYYKYQPGQGDRAAGGVEIVASYLNDEVAREIDAWKEANDGYTPEQERANQERIIKAYQAKHGVGSHIAETVVVPSKDDGKIYLPFKGTYGVSRTQENQTAQSSNKLEEGDFGKVAATFETETGASRYGAFSGGAINSAKRRHINTDYMYIYPKIEGRDVKNSAFPMNMFQNYEDQGGMTAGYKMVGLQFPLINAQPIFDIPEYNSYDNKGRAGSKVTTKTAGLVPNADYAIRWYATDPAGNQTELEGKECIVKSDEKGVLPSCDFQAPEDLKETTVYTAAVVSVDPASKKMSDRWEIADSFTAVVPEQLPLGSAGEEYPDNNVADLFEKLPDNLAENSKPQYSADKLPDGLEIDPETGKITGTPTKPGTTEVTVTREVEVMVDKYVGVTDENGDPVWENPDEEDPAQRIQKTEKSTVAEKQYEEVVTKITVTDTPLQDGVVGEPYEQEVKPEGFDKLPQGFEIEEGSLKVEGLPDGLTFENGKITGTPTAPVEASEEKPNVTVTYTLVDQNGKKYEQTDIVPLAVKSQADAYDPKGQDQTVEPGAKPKPEDSIANKEDLPDGTEYEWAGEGPNTDEPGDKQGKVVVTYPDGSKDEVDVTVHVTQDPTSVDESGKKVVDPTDEKQDTGVKIVNPDEETKVSAKDEDGKDIPAEMDENGNVHVTPGEDVDGPITLTIEDPDLPGGKAEVEVEVKGHEKGKDDNGSDMKPEAPKTTVDESGKQPVDPSDEKQDTGVKVNNKDGDTKVIAKDEDGKDIPAEIDENGNVHVTPGTDVDGPITLTIEDPDLPGGKVEVEVEVKGHEKDRDDNGSDTKPEAPKTTVDETGAKPVDPTDEKQDTGVKVNNKDKDTNVTAKDEDGKDIPVEIDENGNVHVTPGTDVDGPITVTVTDPDLPGGETEIEVKVNGHEKGRDDNNSDFKVDDSGKKPVDPTNEKQDTGVKVQNPDKDTKISAKDEDGKDVPVEIDKDGNVVVTPGEDVDGPITVTIEDPRLPEGKSQVEIDVNGHEKGRDDNGKAETNVNADGKKPVVPNGKEQDTGVIINNKDGDTKESATDKNGKDVPVRVGDDGKVYVTPGKDVEGPIKLVVEDPDLPGGKAEIEIEVDKAQNPGGEENKPGTGDQTDPSEGDKLGDNVVASYPKTDVRPGATGTAKVQLNKKDGEKVGEAVDTPKGTTATITKRNGGELHGAKWDINVVDGTADITGQAPSPQELAEAFKKKDARTWDEFVKEFAPLANTSVEATVANSTGEQTGVKASFALVDKNGKSMLDPNGDIDGDGIENRDEFNKGLNPFDATDGKVDAGRCAASAVGFGLPLIALLPLGLASQIQIPGLSDFAAQASAQLQAANTHIQQQAGIFNPEMARQVEQINAQLRTVGADLGMVAAGIVLIAAGILAGTVIYDNCKPGGPSSSVKDLELKGSSGKTTKLSSEKEQK